MIVRVVEHLRRTALIAVFVAALAAPATAIAQVAPLREGEAEFFMRKALKREFGNTFNHGEGRSVECHDRRSNVRISCRTIAWTIGDISFSGNGRIWLSVNRNGVVLWNYAFRIKRVNEYCVATGGTDCVEVIEVE